VIPLWLKSWKEKAKKLKIEIYALYLAYRDPRVPWYAKALIAAIIGYALCPLDLIPDFIPVLGYVDDIIIIPAGITLALKMIPQDVLEECRKRAQSEPISRKNHWIAAGVIVLIWLLAIYVTVKVIWGHVRNESEPLYIFCR
jgi:uncharacterized membrane protein YkvA (DUF1232 family)